VLGTKVKFASFVLMAAVIYYALTSYLLIETFGNMPGMTWFQESLGRLAGARIWAHLVHALALFLAAIPCALLLSIACRPKAVLAAAIAGALTACLGLSESFLFLRGNLYIPSVVHIVIDSIKFVLILMLVTWSATKLPSNYAMQRSARVVTPLAGTASGSQRFRSASGAPTARRR
jgi:hypothetical protein